MTETDDGFDPGVDESDEQVEAYEPAQFPFEAEPADASEQRAEIPDDGEDDYR